MQPTASRASVALEFAIMALPTFVMLLGILELGYDMFTQAVLNYAVTAAARSVQVGAAQGSNDESSATFAAAAVCPSIGILLNCGNLVVGVAPIPSGDSYYSTPQVITQNAAASPNGSICTGQAGQLMLLQAWYIGPSFVGNLIPALATSYNGKLVHITTATTGFLNEDFAGGQSQGVGC
jgi:hypothetical protein